MNAWICSMIRDVESWQVVCGGEKNSSGQEIEKPILNSQTILFS